MPSTCSTPPAKPGPGGSGPLRLTPLQRIDRLATLVPPPRVYRHRYFGVLAELAAARRGDRPRRAGGAASLWPRQLPTRHRPPMNRPTAAPLAMRGPCCSPASMKCSRSSARAAAPTCASSPSSPTHPPCATSSLTSANRWRHSGAHLPAARRCGRCREPGTARSIRRPSRHRPTSSISALPGRAAATRAAAGQGPFVPGATGAANDRRVRWPQAGRRRDPGMVFRFLRHETPD